MVETRCQGFLRRPNPSIGRRCNTFGYNKRKDLPVDDFSRGPWGFELRILGLEVAISSAEFEGDPQKVLSKYTILGFQTM